MEENKTQSNVAEATESKKEKLTYEQVTAYAQQLTEKCKAVIQENNVLKQQLTEVMHNQGIAEAGLAIRCIELSDKFSPEFIAKITKRVEEYLTPDALEKSEEQPTKPPTVKFKATED
jgi:hypothetical protein